MGGRLGVVVDWCSVTGRWVAVLMTTTIAAQWAAIVVVIKTATHPAIRSAA